MFDDNVRLETLHDHYKDTFHYIREREKQRDRLFLVLIALFTLLATTIFYSDRLTNLLGLVSVAGAKVDVSSLPPRPILCGIWVFTLALSLRYCQASINVERQYSYLHILEERISNYFEDETLYRREGRSYITKYPTFSNWAWLSYVALFPIIVCVACIALSIVEWLRLVGWIYSSFDSLIALAVTISFFLYRVWPMIKSKRVPDESVLEPQ